MASLQNNVLKRLGPGNAVANRSSLLGISLIVASSNLRTVSKKSSVEIGEGRDSPFLVAGNRIEKSCTFDRTSAATAKLLPNGESAGD